jgi:hypothetical protein
LKDSPEAPENQQTCPVTLNEASPKAGEAKHLSSDMKHLFFEILSLQIRPSCWETARMVPPKACDSK